MRLCIGLPWRETPVPKWLGPLVVIIRVLELVLQELKAREDTSDEAPPVGFRATDFLEDVRQHKKDLIALATIGATEPEE